MGAEFVTLPITHNFIATQESIIINCQLSIINCRLSCFSNISN